MATFHKCTHKNGKKHWRICLKIGRKRSQITLGYADSKAKEKEYQKKLDVIDDLESLKNSDKQITKDLRKRLNSFDDTFIERVIKSGLVKLDSRSKTLTALFDDWKDHVLVDAKARTARTYRQAVGEFEDFMGGDCKIGDVTEADVERFSKVQIRGGTAKSTIGGYLKRTRSAFSYAIKSGWLDKNPIVYDAKKFPIKKTTEKKKLQGELLTAEILDQLLESPINPEWKVLLSLERWTACRVAEALILRWDDVIFDEEDPRINFRGKDNGSGPDRDNMPVRVCPIFPQLMAVLQDHKSNTEPHDVYVFNDILNLRNKPEFEETKPNGDVVRRGRYETNAHESLVRLLKRLDIETWPQPHHAIRAFRLNEMRREGLSDAQISAWCGNSKDTRAKHYDAVGADDRRMASRVVQMSCIDIPQIDLDGPGIHPELKSFLAKIVDGTYQVVMGT